MTGAGTPRPSAARRLCLSPPHPHPNQPLLPATLIPAQAQGPAHWQPAVHDGGPGGQGRAVAGGRARALPAAHQPKWPVRAKHTRTPRLTCCSSKGFAIVEFSTELGAKRAISRFNGVTVGEREITVRYDTHDPNFVGDSLACVRMPLSARPTTRSANPIHPPRAPRAAAEPRAPREPRAAAEPREPRERPAGQLRGLCYNCNACAGARVRRAAHVPQVRPPRCGVLAAGHVLQLRPARSARPRAAASPLTHGQVTRAPAAPTPSSAATARPAVRRRMRAWQA